MNIQLSALQKDSETLVEYINEVESRNKTELANKLKHKLEFLNSRISELKSA